MLDQLRGLLPLCIATDRCYPIMYSVPYFLAPQARQCSYFTIHINTFDTKETFPYSEGVLH